MRDDEYEFLYEIDPPGSIYVPGKFPYCRPTDDELKLADLKMDRIVWKVIYDRELDKIQHGQVAVDTAKISRLTRRLDELTAEINKYLGEKK